MLYGVIYWAVLKDKIMKLIKTLTQTFKKDEIYILADGDDLIPKHEYGTYFENTDEDTLTDGGEWRAEDRCKKSFKVVAKIYADE